MWYAAEELLSCFHFALRSDAMFYIKDCKRKFCTEQMLLKPIVSFPLSCVNRALKGQLLISDWVVLLPSSENCTNIFCAASFCCSFFLLHPSPLCSTKLLEDDEERLWCLESLVEINFYFNFHSLLYNYLLLSNNCKFSIDVTVGSLDSD